MGNRELLSALAKHALQEAWELQRFGFSWAKEGWRQFKLNDMEGHRFLRGLQGADERQSLALVLGKHLRSRVGVQVLDKIFVTGLLQHKGRAVGAIGIDIDSDALVVLTAGSTVITAGGMEGIFNFGRGRGSGLAMAYRLGAAIIAPDLFEVSTTNEGTSFHCLGGLQVDPLGRTTLPSLYAAGGIVGGIFGAHALPGSWLAANVVFGAIAGRSAGLEKTPIPRIKEEGVKEETIRIQRFLRRMGRSRATTHTLDEFCDELNQFARKGLGPGGSEEILTELTAFLEKVEKDWYVKVRPSTEDEGLNALIDWIEADYVLTNIRLAAGATRMRLVVNRRHDQNSGQAGSYTEDGNTVVTCESGSDRFHFLPKQRQEIGTVLS